MEFTKQDKLKVTCIAAKEDFEFFGITLDDLLDRTEGGFRFLKKAKELAGTNQGVEWTGVAYTLQIGMLQDGRVSLEFSEMIPDYIQNLKHSMIMADEETLEPLKQFIETLEQVDDENARKLIARFEKNVRNVKNT